MKSIFVIYNELQSKSSNTIDGFNIATLPSAQQHKIGISPSGQPMFFIKCESSEETSFIDSNLEFISVQYNRECQLLTNNKKTSYGIYTVISLKADTIDLQEYFLEIVFLVINKLTPNPKLKELKIAIEKLINLFSKFSNLPTKTIQGLWAELLVIEKSRNPEYLIKSWHSSTNDKFDFNDGIDKIEVKSTSRNRRVHTFSLEQINPNKNSNLIIVSVFSVETGIGKSIFDLIELIEKRTKDSEIRIRIYEVLAETLGNSFEKAFDVFFDYQLAADTIHFYDSEIVPSIDTKYIPQQLTNVHFDSDLTEVIPLEKNNSKSTLHKSLF